MNDGLVLRDPPDPRRPDPRPATGARAAADLPDDVATSSDDAEHAANLFALAEFGNIYTRIMNPTQDVRRAADRSSRRRRRRAAASRRGQAAETLAHPQPRRGRGPHGVIPSPVRRHVQPASLHAAEARHRGHLRRGPRRPRSVARRGAAEHQGSSSASPSPTRSSDVLDIEGVAGVAHEAGVPLIVDNTIATPYLVRPSSGAPTSSCTRPPSTSAVTARRSAE